MIGWAKFPALKYGTRDVFHRVHQRSKHAAWFSSDGSWRFDPPVSHRHQFGTCYLGFDEMAPFVEVFGRMRTVPQPEIDRRALTKVTLAFDGKFADLTNRRVVGRYGVTAAHSTGTDYGPSQLLAAELFDAGFDGIRYRVRHDPAMELEGLALFGEPGETPSRLGAPKTSPIPPWLIDAGRDFGIEVVPAVALP
jgi:hypothetical protein